MVDLELAVLQQEVSAGREEVADLRAKVYLLEKEKGAMELAMGDRWAIHKGCPHWVVEVVAQKQTKWGRLREYRHQMRSKVWGSKIPEILRTSFMDGP